MSSSSRLGEKKVTLQQLSNNAILVLAPLIFVCPRYGLSFILILQMRKLMQRKLSNLSYNLSYMSTNWEAGSR